MFETETKQVYEMRTAHEIFSGLGTIKEVDASQVESSEREKCVEDSNASEAAQPGVLGTTAEKPERKKVFIDDDAGTSEEQALQRALNIASTWDNVKVFPLGGGGDDSSIKDVFRRSRYQELFDLVWVNSLQVHHIAPTDGTPGIQACLAKPASAVVVETLRHIPTIRKNLKLGYVVTRDT